MTISKELFEIIKDEAENTGIDLRTNYSGRGMYGRKCIGFSGDMRDIQDTMRRINITCHEKELENEESEVFFEWTDGCFNYSQDSMGLDIIIYWPMWDTSEK